MTSTSFNKQVAEALVEAGYPQPISPTSSVMALQEWNQREYDNIQAELSGLIESRNNLSNRIDELNRMEKVVVAALQVSEELKNQPVPDSPPSGSYYQP